MLGGGLLTLVLLGGLRWISYQNAIALIQSSAQVEQSKEGLNHLDEIAAHLIEDEPNQSDLILSPSFSTHEQNKQFTTHLEEHFAHLQQKVPEQVMNLQLLRQLIKQRKDLIAQSIAQSQNKTASQSPSPERQSPNARLSQNQRMISQTLLELQQAESRSLQKGILQTAIHTREHLTLEFLSTVLILLLFLMGYGLLYRQILKRQTVEAEKTKLAQSNELSTLKLELFSMISHEFRTPLSLILGSSQLIEEQTQIRGESKNLKNLHRIQSAARNMNHLLTDLLTLARAEVGKLEFHPQKIDLEGFCLNLIEDIKLAQAPERIIEFMYQDKNSYATLDESLLYSILGNLLSNALKYSEINTLVRFSVQRDSDFITFKIQDHGAGIPAEQQSHLFEPFRRGQNAGTVKGSGLGLAVVKAGVTLHQGSIDIESDLTSGTTVIVQIPQV